MNILDYRVNIILLKNFNFLKNNLFKNQIENSFFIIEEIKKDLINKFFINIDLFYEEINKNNFNEFILNSENYENISLKELKNLIFDKVYNIIKNLLSFDFLSIKEIVNLILCFEILKKNDNFK